MSDLSGKQNQAKINGLGADPLQRLTSLKPPRELSLGASKPAKKVFTPNLNVARNKSKGPSSTNNRDKSHDAKQRDRKSDRNKNCNKNEQRVIKSSGVFSEGLGSVESRGSRGVSYGARENTSHQPLQKPTIRIKDAVKIDKEMEDAKICEATAGGGALGDEVAPCEDFRRSIKRDAPVRLPLIDGGLSYKPVGAPLIKQEVVVKLEPADEEGLSPPVSSVPPVLAVGIKEEVWEQTDVVRLLRSEEPQLILLQLPDSLPGRGRHPDDDDDTRTDPDKQTEEPRCTLDSLGEGRAGRLRVHRSGRVTLLLGGTAFEVSAGTAPVFYQEAVSVGVDCMSRAASLVSLGRVPHKLNVTPAWDLLFTPTP